MLGVTPHAVCCPVLRSPLKAPYGLKCHVWRRRQAICRYKKKPRRGGVFVSAAWGPSGAGDRLIPGMLLRCPEETLVRDPQVGYIADKSPWGRQNEKAASGRLFCCVRLIVAMGNCGHRKMNISSTWNGLVCRQCPHIARPRCMRYSPQALRQSQDGGTIFVSRSSS